VEKELASRLEIIDPDQVPQTLRQMLPERINYENIG